MAYLAGMSAVTIAGMLAAEAAAKSAGWTESQLIELAGKRLGRAVHRFFGRPGTAIGFLGKGHNAADVLVALQALRDSFGWQVAARHAFAESDWAPLMLHHARQAAIPVIGEPVTRATDFNHPMVLIDGLVGLGARGALREPLTSLAREMNALRQTAGARIAAADLPSGLDPDSGTADGPCVTADVTFMIANAKLGLLKGHASNHVGALALVPVEILSQPGQSDLELISPQTLDLAKAPRPFDFHKGLAGRVSVIAGSPRYTGAAILAAIGALHGGAGLVTLHAPHPILPLVLSRCPPEIMVAGFDSPLETLSQPADARVIGCGIGTPDGPAAQDWLDAIFQPAIPSILDADALNLIARTHSQDRLQPHHLLTPHPGEFQRLAPDLAAHPREVQARTFAARFPATLLLKGSRTLIARHGHPLRVNSTGHPGMATGGQGDLLAGVLGALAAGGLPHHHAAALGAWLCGRAAEIALAQDQSTHSLTPTTTARHLGQAFLDWQLGAR